MVIYFTGTGNSRYLARRMARKLGDSLVDAGELIKRDETRDFSSEKPYVFVCPTYAWKIPKVFEAFLRRCSFHGSERAYFVMTCAKGIGGAGLALEALCGDKGLIYCGVMPILMPENYIAVFSAPDRVKSARLVEQAGITAYRACRLIQDAQPFPPVEPGWLVRRVSGTVNKLFYQKVISAKKFFSTGSCNSCGRCVRLCPMNNISLEGGRPVWGERCTHCMACISGCPNRAIEYGRHTKKLRRHYID